MTDRPRRRQTLLTRSARYASPLAVVVLVLAFAGIGGTVRSSTGAESAAARAPRPTVRAMTDTPLAGYPGDVAAAPGATEAAAKTVKPRVRTMSLDDAIQGGLTAREEQAQSARTADQHQTPFTAPAQAYWTPAMGRTAAQRAASWIGMPYSWAAGNAAGPTAGLCDRSNGGDLDCHVVGFDCSGLVMYAWGAYAALPHLAESQLSAGSFHPTVDQLQPGDLVFFAGYLPGGVGHVAVYAGGGTVIEAPQSGSLVRQSSLREVMAEDGAYRGAVRPLTGPTPVLRTRQVVLPAEGGLVTLRGAHLSSADAVQFGGVTVRRFVRRSDSLLAFRAPANRAGTVTLSVTTPWLAPAPTVSVTYAAPPPTRAPTPVTPTPTTTPTTASPTAEPTTPTESRPTNSTSRSAPRAPSSSRSPSPSGSHSSSADGPAPATTAAQASDSVRPTSPASKASGSVGSTESKGAMSDA